MHFTIRTRLLFDRSDFGSYNVSVSASNAATNTTPTDELIAIVASSDACRPPAISMPYASVDIREPAEFYRSERVVVEATVAVQCAGVINTK